MQEYYENFHDWKIPDFSDKCPICGGVNCASYHGTYTRGVICPLTGFSVLDFQVLRYFCKKTGNDRTCNHKTFSLLPFMLVPYRLLPLNFMILAVWLRINRHLSLTTALDVIEDELSSLDDILDCINISAVRSWEQMIMAAIALFLSTDINMITEAQYKQLQGSDGFWLFLKIIIDYKSKSTNHPIRGPDIFSWDFYQQSGETDQCAFFLFGKASQHRI